MEGEQQDINITQQTITQPPATMEQALYINNQGVPAVQAIACMYGLIMAAEILPQQS